jgi:hypothetical protein
MAAKPVNYTTQQLIDYITAGGNISDLVGSNVSQSGLLSKLLADPRLLSAVGQQVASSGGGTFDPSQTYTNAAVPFEAANNTVRLKYSQRSPVEQQIANMVFDTIDEGKDPTTVVSAIDDSFLKPYGVTTSDVASLIADLATDAPKYIDAKAAQNTALQKQQYNAFVKQTGGTGTGAGALATRLGIPSLANLPDPSKTYAINRESLLSDRFGQQKYVPTSMDKAIAAKATAGVIDQSARPAKAQQMINSFIDPNGKYGLFPTSILGNKIMGSTTLNQIINGALSDVVSTGVAGIGSGVLGASIGSGITSANFGFNPMAKNARRTDFTKQDAAAQQKAYQEALTNSTGALNMGLKNQSEQRIATKAAQILNERIAKLTESGITPFTQQARGLVPMLKQTKTKIKKK